MSISDQSDQFDFDDPCVDIDEYDFEGNSEIDEEDKKFNRPRADSWGTATNPPGLKIGSSTQDEYRYPGIFHYDRSERIRNWKQVKNRFKACTRKKLIWHSTTAQDDSYIFLLRRYNYAEHVTNLNRCSDDWGFMHGELTLAEHKSRRSNLTAKSLLLFHHTKVPSLLLEREIEYIEWLNSIEDLIIRRREERERQRVALAQEQARQAAVRKLTRKRGAAGKKGSSKSSENKHKLCENFSQMTMVESDKSEHVDFSLGVEQSTPDSKPDSVKKLGLDGTINNNTMTGKGRESSDSSIQPGREVEKMTSSEVESTVIFKGKKGIKQRNQKVGVQKSAPRPLQLSTSIMVNGSLDEVEHADFSLGAEQSTPDSKPNSVKRLGLVGTMNINNNKTGKGRESSTMNMKL